MEPAAEHDLIDRKAVALSGDQLRLERGSRTIIDNLSFGVAAGQALVLRGANGSGKTSLLRILAGLTLPDSGSVSWRAEILKPLSATWRNVALYLGHTNALKEDFTAEENLSDAVAIDGMAIPPSAQLAALDRVGLLDRRNVQARRLSQGQKRRVGLARLSLAIAHAPRKPLWLLDEPTNALDQRGVALFTDLIREHLGSGGIACIATHLALNLALPAIELNLDTVEQMSQ
jgi:heme exporter protein A